MIESVCRHIKNYFIAEAHAGSFTVSGGVITDADFLADGYYLIWGSKYNDGVHLYPDDTLIDETFSGDIAIMNPPDRFLEICEQITEYCSSGDASPSPYKKESFGDYSYERDEGGSLSWQKAFSTQLNEWRKV